MEASHPRRRGRGRVRAVLVVVLTLAALGLGGPGAAADDAATAAEKRARDQAFARDLLMGRARDAVDPSNREAGGLEDIAANVQDQRDLLQRIAPRELARVDALLGVFAEDDQGQRVLTDGLIRQAAVLYRYITGEGTAPPMLFFYDPARRKKPVAFGEPLPAEAIDWDLRPAPDPRGAANTVRLDGIEDLRTPEILPVGALTRPDELTLQICRPLIDAREKQRAVRVQRFGDEQAPRGLVNEATVRAKEERAQRFRDEVKRQTARRAETEAALDELLVAERAAKGAAGSLGFKIEEAKTQAGADDPTTEAGQELERLQLQEILREQELRLLYIAVRRSERRLALYGEAIRQAKDESLAAESALGRFTAELSRKRRESQIDRLAYEAASLGEQQARARAQAEAEGAPELPKAYADALARLLDLNAIVGEAVQLRRTLESRSKPETKEGAPVEGPGAAAAAPAAPSAATAPPATGPCDVPAVDELRRFRETHAAALDVNYISDAMNHLDDEGWDGDLVAEHYAAVDDRIRGQESALTLTGGAESLRKRFETVAEAARQALATVEGLAQKSASPWEWRYRLREHRRENLEANLTAFANTDRGIQEEAGRIRERLDVFRRFRERLLDLGTRSFKIRVQRELSGQKLGQAWSQVSGAAGAATEWLTLQGADHAGTFARERWPALLGCLALLVASFLGVRFGRHRLSAVIASMAARVPALQAEAVTVEAEAAEAKRAREQVDAAARAAEQQALKAVAQEPPAVPQTPAEPTAAELSPPEAPPPVPAAPPPGTPPPPPADGERR